MEGNGPMLEQNNGTNSAEDGGCGGSGEVAGHATILGARQAVRATQLINEQNYNGAAKRAAASAVRYQQAAKCFSAQGRCRDAKSAAASATLAAKVSADSTQLLKELLDVQGLRYRRIAKAEKSAKKAAKRAAKSAKQCNSSQATSMGNDTAPANEEPAAMSAGASSSGRKLLDDDEVEDIKDDLEDDVGLG